MLVIAFLFGVVTGALNGFMQKKVPLEKRGIADFTDCLFDMTALYCAYEVTSFQIGPKHLWASTIAGVMVTAFLSALLLRKLVSYLICR